MTFTEFHTQAWADHASDANGVALRIPASLALAQTTDEISQMASLITHVFGEHLGRWSDGAIHVRSIPTTDPVAREAIDRSAACLELAGGTREAISEFSISNQIRILALAASALAERDATRAQKLFRDALSLVDKVLLTKDDPAHRALAVAGNNLAASIEEKPSRTPEDVALMLLGAETGRRFWEIAGNWLQVERAEYRLSVSSRLAGMLDAARDHALKCLEISTVNNALPLELFYAHEALALVAHSRGDTETFARELASMREAFATLKPEVTAWCEPALRKVEALQT